MTSIISQSPDESAWSTDSSQACWAFSALQRRFPSGFNLVRIVSTTQQSSAIVFFFLTSGKSREDEGKSFHLHSQKDKPLFSISSYLRRLLLSGLDLSLARFGVGVGLNSRLESRVKIIDTLCFLSILEQFFEFSFLSALAQKLAERLVVGPDWESYKDSVIDGRLVDLIDLEK